VSEAPRFEENFWGVAGLYLNQQKKHCCAVATRQSTVKRWSVCSRRGRSSPASASLTALLERMAIAAILAARSLKQAASWQRCD
jgi:hypothetical protein